jgi:hypothetical protein
VVIGLAGRLSILVVGNMGITKIRERILQVVGGGDTMQSGKIGACASPLSNILSLWGVGGGLC